MRIFQLNTYCGVKSTGRIALEIAKLVTKDGGECRIGYGIPEISPDSAPFAYRIGSPLERKLHGAVRKLFDAEGYGSLLATKALLQELDRFEPDLIHLHNVHGCYLNLKHLFAYLAAKKLPVVWTLHDCWPFTGHCAYFDFCGCEKWKEGCFDCPQQKSYPVCVGLDGSFRNYAKKKEWFLLPEQITFVAPCHWLTKHLKASFLRRYPVRIIPNGVNRVAFQPVSSDLRRRFHLENAHICLAVASEWDARKGLSHICKAAEMMGERYRFVVIGLDSQQTNGLPPNVLAIPKTSSTEELAAWYSTSDCFVNPTLEDNMPMVNLEALACGTPVVVFETGGCPEAIDDTCGIVVPKGDTALFCKAIQKICESPIDWQTNCLQRSELFDSQKTFQAYLDLYKELCL